MGVFGENPQSSGSHGFLVEKSEKLQLVSPFANVFWLLPVGEQKAGFCPCPFLSDVPSWGKPVAVSGQTGNLSVGVNKGALTRGP